MVGMTAPLLEVTVVGHAEPGGSKKAFVPQRDGHPIRGHGGRIIVNVVDDNPRAKGWQTVIAQRVSEVWEEPSLHGPLVVEFTFYRRRPQTHFGSGRNEGVLKDWAAVEYPVAAPDLLKTARAAEDALTGVLWHDDSRIVEERLRKHYGDPERLEIKVWEADVNVAATVALREFPRRQAVAAEQAQLLIDEPRPPLLAVA